MVDIENIHDEGYIIYNKKTEKYLSLRNSDFESKESVNPRWVDNCGNNCLHINKALFTSLSSFLNILRSHGIYRGDSGRIDSDLVLIKKRDRQADFRDGEILIIDIIKDLI